jgi:hypothetical protein
MKFLNSRSRLGYAAPLLVVFVCLLMGYAASDTIFPNVDILNDFENAYSLLHDGTIPHAGSISSFGSYNPPGVSYGLVPGILMGGNTPGGANRLASAFWFSLSVLGLFLYVMKRFGIGPAVVATLIYAVGPPGIFFATSLWPRAHPVFLIWLLYFCDSWFVDKKANSIIMILAIAGLASYWMLEFLPALCVIPIGILIYRPKIRLLPVAAGSLLFLLIWMPYLLFQWDREFVDLHSLLTRTDIGAELKQDPTGELGLSGLKLVSKRPHRWDSYFRDYKDVELAPKGFFKDDPRFGKIWVLNKLSEVDGQKGHLFKPNNDPLWYFQSAETLRIHQQKTGWEEEPYPERIALRTPPEKETRIVSRDRWSVVLLGNFRGIVSPFLKPIFPWVLLVWALLLTIIKKREEGMGPLVKGSLMGLFLIIWLYSVYFSVSATQAALSSLSLFIGIALGLPALMVTLVFLKKTGSKMLSERLSVLQSDNRSSLLVLVLFLAIPWALIGILVWNSSWPGAGRRFQWLYILQAALMGIILCQLLSLFRSRYVSWIAITAVISIIGVNFRSTAEFHRFIEGDFLKEGSNKVDIVEWIGDYAEDHNLEELSIGYDMPFKQFHLHWHKFDPRYKVGRDFDTQLFYDQGILNQNTSPQGISDSDDLILVDKWGLKDPSNRFWDLRQFKRRKIILENDRWVVLEPQPD